MKKPVRDMFSKIGQIAKESNRQATLCRNEKEAYDQMLAQLDALSANAKSVEIRNGEESLKESLRLLSLSSKNPYA